MRAAAELRETPSTSTTRTMSPYFSPKSTIAPSLRASSSVVSKMCSGRFAKIARLTRCSICLALLRRQLRGVREVEAELVGTHGRARLLTCSPSTSRSAACSRCVAVWFAIVGNRTVHGTTRAHAVAGGEALAAEEEHLVVVEAVGLDELRANGRVVVELDPALVGDLAATRG